MQSLLTVMLTSALDVERRMVRPSTLQRFGRMAASSLSGGMCTPMHL